MTREYAPLTVPLDQLSDVHPNYTGPVPVLHLRRRGAGSNPVTISAGLVEQGEVPTPPMLQDGYDIHSTPTEYSAASITTIRTPQATKLKRDAIEAFRSWMHDCGMGNGNTSVPPWWTFTGHPITRDGQGIYDIFTQHGLGRLEIAGQTIHTPFASIAHAGGSLLLADAMRLQPATAILPRKAV